MNGRVSIKAMPLIRGAASDVTTFRRINASSVSDPTIKTATFSPNYRYLLPSLRTSAAGAGVSPGQSVLATPQWKGYVNPRHQGLIVRPIVPPPFIFDFQDQVLEADGFIELSDAALSGPTTVLRFVITNFQNPELISSIELSNFVSDEVTDPQQFVFSAVPEFGSQTLDDNVALYDCTTGAYTADVVFTIDFKVAVSALTIRLYNYS